ncbi:MAG: glycosyltransferase [Chloroflexi bacterium]|nr:glycosyltransferase [Chloroflexota bacterium]
MIRKDNVRLDGYDHITISKYYRPKKWLVKVKSSTLGFWAPGDQGAMTLKLGEFMACGKAIIAVPIRSEMLPSPLVHREHVHFVDGSMAEMKAAVELLMRDHEYRRKLERNARKYYEQWIAPEQAMRRFIKEGCKRVGVTYDDLL